MLGATRQPAILAGFAVLALICVGCGSASSGPTPENGTAAASSKGQSSQDKAVKFSQCMRGNGVPHFPDPDPKGEYNFGVDVSVSVWKKAVAACKELEPPGALSAKRTPTQQSDALRFAACVRQHGVPDFPDPANGQPMIDTTQIPSSNKPGGMTILNAATDKCGSILERAAGGQK